jgi:hypothetical protein
VYAAHLGDVDGDGSTDFVTHYRSSKTTIEKGDTGACLTAETVSGVELVGCDRVGPK